MSVLMLELDPEQVRDVLKQTIKRANAIDPGMLVSVLKEVRQESETDSKFDRALNEVFTEFDDVLKALA